MRLRQSLVALAAALLLSVPWVGVWAADINLNAGATVLVSGFGVLGASFLLAWAAETAEKDVPRAFAIAVLAVLAVAPEYAVDALYAWTAGAKGATGAACNPGDVAHAGCQAANLAAANMTGANRILIGIGWAGIVIFTILKARRTDDPAVEYREGWLASIVTLDRDIATEITFLFLATVWAFFVPLQGGIDILDFIILVGLYVLYIGIVVRSDVDTTEEHIGVPAYLQDFKKKVRIPAVVGLFAYAGFLIFIAVEPFAHGLEYIGTAIGVPSFFMIQWIAPLASESPELVVVTVLVYKARSTAGFNALISSKLNQWTLLIGTLVVVYSIALGRIGTLPFERIQAAEIWITAAQSFFALTLIIDFRISVREAVALFVLFISQVGLEFIFLKIWQPFPDPKFMLLMSYTAIYMIGGVALLIHRREDFYELVELAAFTAKKAAGRQPTKPDHD